VEASDVLAEAYRTIRELVRHAAEGLPAATLVARPDGEANTIAWLLWHLTRVQDHHVAELTGDEQLWVTGTWAAGTGLRPDPDDTGYGHTPEQVAAVRPDGPERLVAYHEAVAARTLAHLASAAPHDLERVVDRSYDPPVTAGVRLTSVVIDSLQHVGQAAYVRGLLARRRADPRGGAPGQRPAP
jgi:hypothetical protein